MTQELDIIEQSQPVKLPPEVMARLPEKAKQAPSEVMRILELALDKNVSGQELEKIVALGERMADRQAAAEFADALAHFQGTCPPIAKTSTAKITTRNGGEYKYRYAELDEIARTVREPLQAVGLSYSWDSSISQDNGMLECVCTLRHMSGYTQTARFRCPTSTTSAMNDQQRHAAALTFARRQSLIQALGLTTTDPDTDAGDGKLPVYVTDDQVQHLAQLIEESDTKLDKFLKAFGAASLPEVRAAEYPRAVDLLERKIKKNAAEKREPGE